MAKGKKTKNGANKKLHNKLIKQKKVKLQEAKAVRNSRLKQLNKIDNAKGED